MATGTKTGKGREIDINRLNDVCGAYAAVQELVLLGTTVKEYEGDLNFLNPNHFYDLLLLLNNELRHALGKD